MATLREAVKAQHYEFWRSRGGRLCQTETEENKFRKQTEENTFLK